MPGLGLLYVLSNIKSSPCNEGNGSSWLYKNLAHSDMVSTNLTWQEVGPSKSLCGVLIL